MSRHAFDIAHRAAQERDEALTAMQTARDLIATDRPGDAMGVLNRAIAKQITGRRPPIEVPAELALVEPEADHDHPRSR